MKKILLFFLLFCGVANAQNIVITEIMYNPPESGTDTSEFIEFYNNTAASIDLTDYTVTGITYTFPSVTLASGDFFVLAVSTSGFTNTYGFAPDGVATGGLSNGGELISLFDNNGILVDEVDYDDAAPWPSGSAAEEPDGGGASIRLCDEDVDNNDGNSWSASTTSTGMIVNGLEIFATPGATSNCCSTVFGTDTQTSCDPITWIDGNTYSTSNNTAMFNIVNGSVNGCDSLVTLDLTILQPATGTDVKIPCSDSFTWIDGNTYTSNNSTATHTIPNGAANGCDSIVTLNLTFNTVDVSVTTNGNTISADLSGASYQWIDCGTNTAISGETNQSFTATSNGSYAVVINDGTCTDTSACQTITGLSIDKQDSENISIYPNPSNGQFKVVSNNSFDYYITDLAGKVVLRGTFTNNKTLDLSHLESGVYLLNIQMDEGLYSKRLIKE